MGSINERSFIQLMDRWYQFIYRIALSMLDDEEEACDVTQESFERLWRHRKKVDEKAAPTWLRRTALNLCTDILRKRKIEWVSENEELELTDPGGDPLKDVVNRERSLLLRKALNRLPEKLRIAVVLKDIEGLTYREISELLNRPVNTVKSDVFKGRRMLQRILKPYLGR